MDIEAWKQRTRELLALNNQLRGISGKREDDLADQLQAAAEVIERLKKELAQERAWLKQSDYLLGSYAHKLTLAEAEIERQAREIAELKDKAGDDWATIIGIQSLSENWASGVTSAQESMAEIHTMLLDAARAKGDAT